MYDVVIIGGGIVGLTVAYQILLEYPLKKVLILEKEKHLSIHQTGHNSGVIHSGIYYKPNSLKARNCRKGIELLINFCQKYNIKYEMCGKIIVASKKNQIDYLNELFDRGGKNGITGLKLIDKDDIANYEPYAVGEKALYCPETGIINYSDVCEVLSDLISQNGKIITSAKVKDISKKNKLVIVHTEREEFETKFLINCAGLFSDKISQLAGLERIARIVPFRGEYYMLRNSAQCLVKNLIYPVPNPNYPFLGVHFTRTINGEIEAGPNAVLAFSREGYAMNDINFIEIFDYLSYPGFWKMVRKYWKTGLHEYYRSVFKKSFLESLQNLIPSITLEDIEKSPAGVRAQAVDFNGKLVDDFVIHRTQNMIHVLNAPSPAATSSFSIGLYIKGLYSSKKKLTI